MITSFSVGGEWIPFDDASRVDAPEWTRALPSGLTLADEGVALVDGSTVSIARWSDVLGAVVVDAKLYVLVPRHAPHAPWFECSPKEVTGDRTLDATARAIESRVRTSGYRSAPVPRELVAPEELLARLRARVEVPGAVEVPIGPGPEGRKSQRLELLGKTAGIVGATGYFGVMVSIEVGAAIGAGLLLCAGAVALFDRLRPRYAPPRVLALAPDGCVIGLPGGARAFGWSEIAAFEASDYVFDFERAAQPCLVVRGSDREPLGRIDADWFTRPLPLIVAVAEAYRARFAR